MLFDPHNTPRAKTKPRTRSLVRGYKGGGDRLEGVFETNDEQMFQNLVGLEVIEATASIGHRDIGAESVDALIFRKNGIVIGDREIKTRQDLRGKIEIASIETGDVRVGRVERIVGGYVSMDGDIFGARADADVRRHERTIFETHNTVDKPCGGIEGIVGRSVYGTTTRAYSAKTTRTRRALIKSFQFHRRLEPELHEVANGEGLEVVSRLDAARATPTGVNGVVGGEGLSTGAAHRLMRVDVVRKELGAAVGSDIKTGIRGTGFGGRCHFLHVRPGVGRERDCCRQNCRH
jgi:hypothetical protein